MLNVTVSRFLSRVKSLSSPDKMKHRRFIRMCVQLQSATESSSLLYR